MNESRPKGAGRMKFNLDFEVAVTANYHDDACMPVLNVWLDDQEEPARMFITTLDAERLAHQLLAAVARDREING